MPTVHAAHDIKAPSQTRYGQIAPGAGSLWARSAAPVTGWNGETDDGWWRQVRVLRMEYQDIVELRHGAHRGAKRTLEQQRSKEMRDKTGEEVIEYFKQWAGNANVRAAICGPRLSDEERQRKIMAIFGRVVPVPEPVVGDPSEAPITRQLPTHRNDRGQPRKKILTHDDCVSSQVG